jgi:hypothetical protein
MDAVTAEAPVEVCKGPECDHTKIVAYGLCTSHYRQQHRGRKLTALRKFRGLVRLPMVIRITPETLKTLKKRTMGKGKTAKSMYEACRQALEAGIATWSGAEAGTALQNALLVFLLTPAVRAQLDALDPKAVEQAQAALKGWLEAMPQNANATSIELVVPTT